MREVVVKIAIETAPKNVISAFTDPVMLNDWWSVEKIFIEKKQGGIYTLSWKVSEHGLGYVSTGIIKNYDPNSELVIHDFIYLSTEKPFLGPMTLTIRAKEKNGATEVYLCQAGYQKGKDWNWYYDAVKEAWPNVMLTLKNYLEK